jgi:hypothetical protein
MAITIALMIATRINNNNSRRKLMRRICRSCVVNKNRSGANGMSCSCRRLKKCSRIGMPAATAHHRAVCHVAHQRAIEGGFGRQRNEIDAVQPALAPQTLAPLAHALDVAFAQMPWLRLDRFQLALGIDEARFLTQLQIDFARIQDVEDQHLVLAVPEVLQTGEYLVGIVDQIADDHHQTAAPDAIGHLREYGTDIRLLTRLDLAQTGHQVGELLATTARRNHLDGLLIEGHQTHRVVLLHQQVAQGRRQ